MPGRKTKSEKALIHRANHLKRLKFRSYTQYLQSDLWQTIRLKVFERHGRACYACGRYASQVHHRKYTFRAMKGIDIGPLIPVCAQCHKQAEFKKDGTKATLSRANKKLKRSRKQLLDNTRISGYAGG